MSETQGDYVTDQLVRLPYYGPHGQTMTAEGILAPDAPYLAKQREAASGTDSYDKPAAACDEVRDDIRQLFAEVLRDAAHDYQRAWFDPEDGPQYRKKLEREWDVYEAQMLARLERLLKGGV